MLTRQRNVTKECPVQWVASEAGSGLHHFVTGELPSRMHPMPTLFLKTIFKPDVITLEESEIALLHMWYHCTIKLDTYTRMEFSWGKNTKYSEGQNLHSMHKIKHLIADWRTQGMIPNRISTLHKDLFRLMSKIQAGKYRWKQGTSILIVKVRPEHRTVGDRQYNDQNRRECALSLINQMCPALADWDQT